MRVCIIVMQLEITVAVFGLLSRDVNMGQFQENCFVILRINGFSLRHIMGENIHFLLKKAMRLTLSLAF